MDFANHERNVKNIETVFASASGTSTKIEFLLPSKKSNHTFFSIRLLALSFCFTLITMTASPLRMPFTATSHNRKRRVVHPLQDKKLHSSDSSDSQDSTFPAGQLQDVTNGKPDYASSNNDNSAGIFRSRPGSAHSEELEEFWTLKRANPINEDEEDLLMAFESPSKRNKTLYDVNRLGDDDDDEPLLLNWDDTR